MKRTRMFWGMAVVASILFLSVSACKKQPAAPAGPNTLTSQEQNDGWQLLFDGQSLSGWRGYLSDSLPGKWVVADSAIHFIGKGEGTGGDIITAQSFDNYELELDWKIGPCGNSGIIYRVVEDSTYDTVWKTGPEMQVLDNSCHPDAKNGNDRKAGADYALYPPEPETAVRPAGEWNHVKLVVNGNHVEHWLNGQKVVYYELGSPDWKKRVAASKFNEIPSYGTGKTGHIALQDHGDPVWYRNIKIRPIAKQPV